MNCKLHVFRTCLLGFLPPCTNNCFKIFKFVSQSPTNVITFLTRRGTQTTHQQLGAIMWCIIKEVMLTRKGIKYWSPSNSFLSLTPIGTGTVKLFKIDGKFVLYKWN